MRLFRIHLDPRSRQARRDLADPYQMHATLCRVFFPADTPCPAGALLWRLEPETDREGRPRILIQSRATPDWSRLATPDWLAHADPGIDLGESYQPILLGAGLYRRSVFDRVGGFEPVLRAGEDLDMAARIGEAGVRIAVTTEIVLVYRRHDRSAVAKAGAVQRGQFDAIRSRLRRGGHA